MRERFGSLRFNPGYGGIANNCMQPNKKAISRYDFLMIHTQLDHKITINFANMQKKSRKVDFQRDFRGL